MAHPNIMVRIMITEDEKNGLFSQVAAEMQRREYQKDVMARAMIEFGPDEKTAMRAYARLRYEQLARQLLMDKRPSADPHPQNSHVSNGKEKNKPAQRAIIWYLSGVKNEYSGLAFVIDVFFWSAAFANKNLFAGLLVLAGAAAIKIKFADSKNISWIYYGSVLFLSVALPGFLEGLTGHSFR